MKKLKGLFISAVIAAAGKGSRMNMDINKQYIEIDGIPVLARTLTIFQNCRLVDEIILVVDGEDIPFCKREIVDLYELDKVKTITAGGSQRQQSVYKGLLQVDRKAELVIIHDGARPFLETEDLIEAVKAAYEHGAASLAVKVKDTIKRSDNEGMAIQTVERTNLWAVQTPQVFKLDLIMEAHRKAIQDGFSGTDDTVLVERMDRRVKLVEGSYFNIKITTQEDLTLAEGIAGQDV